MLCPEQSRKLLINILLTAVIVKAAADVGTMIARLPIMDARMRICGLLSTAGASISSRLWHSGYSTVFHSKTLLDFICVKWMGYVSHFFSLSAGVRQGGVLSPFLFAFFVDSLVDKVRANDVGCYFKSACVFGGTLNIAQSNLLVSVCLCMLTIFCWLLLQLMRYRHYWLLVLKSLRLNVNKSLCIYSENAIMWTVHAMHCYPKMNR